MLAQALLSPGVSAQVAIPVTESRVRDMARAASREAKGEPTELVLSFDRRARDAFGDFDSFPISIVRTEDLLVTVTAPLVAFRRSLTDMLKAKRPIASASWVGTVVIDVQPRRLGAPDVTSVTLTRGGAAVSPTQSALRQMTFNDGTGGERLLHAGAVHFGPSAFAPGAEITVTLTTPRDAIVRSFSEAELGLLK